MRRAWIYLIAFFIGLSALIAEKPFLRADFNQISETLQSAPLLQNTALKDEVKHRHEKTMYIAQDFIPFVLIANALNPNVDFVHYIPLFNLLRQKEYFLLI